MKNWMERKNQSSYIKQFQYIKRRWMVIILSAAQLVFLGVFSQPILAQDPGSAAVTLRIELPRRYTPGTKVFLALHSRDDYNTDRVPRYTAVVTPSVHEAELRLLNYTFEQVEPGMFVISGFVDENGDQRLNLSLFGPTEPWDILGTSRPMLRMPRFDSVAVLLPETKGLVLRMR